MKKTVSNKFFVKNNMDPDNVLDKLKGLTEIKKMLIVQIFIIMTVYWLWEEQTRYRKNVINFLQDVQEFTNQLLQNSLSLNILVIY